jgi:hypothetical protein
VMDHVHDTQEFYGRHLDRGSRARYPAFCSGGQCAPDERQPRT